MIIKVEKLNSNAYMASSFKLRGSCLLFFLLSLVSFAQVTSSIDTTKIRIGEQITFKVLVESDSTDLVVFPEGQTFMPLEMIASFKIDTTKNNNKFQLIKEYALTQFDSGAYTIPKQKIVVGDNIFYTDSLRVEVQTVAVDTTKQKLFDIKPIIIVEKAMSKWWLYTLIGLLVLALIGFVLYWFIWRKKPLSEEEKIALLPPYDRAKMALKKLDESDYLQKEELKDYYSELTFIIRKYLDEKVYDRALESTTDQLVDRLNILRDGNQIELSTNDIKNIETILKRADLVKFAKSAPDVELARLDRNTIDIEIDQVKEALPEPTEEEKLLNEKYRDDQERKQKRKKIWLTVAASILIVIATFVGFGLKYGFKYVVDTITGEESKELLEGKWVRSDYGIPPIMITTPVVLERIDFELADELKDKILNTSFRYLSTSIGIDIQVSTTKFTYTDEEKEQASSDEAKARELLVASEKYIQTLEANGATNITVKREQFITPNAAEGFKTYGTLMLPLDDGELVPANYKIILFKAENVRQQIILQWRGDNVYTDEIIERVLNSIELKKLEE
jgi:hypothetical protein